MTKLSSLLSLRRFLPIALLPLASLARAGHWVTTYTGGTGTPSSFSGSSLGGGTPTPYAMFNDGTYGGGGVDASGPITATLTWTPDGPSDTSAAPATVYVLETCTASGTSDNSNGPSSSPAAAAISGLGQPAATVLTHPYYGTYVQYTADVTDTRISLQAVFGGSVHVTASPHAAGGISASVHYAAAATDLALSIHSDRDESFHKGANGPESNLTNILTPRFGDTWVDPSSATAYADQSGTFYYFSTPTFTNELIGSWINPSREWNLDGTTFSDNYFATWNSVSKEFDFSDDDFAKLSDTPASKIVTLKVTDLSNGAVANATYTMRLHHPTEKWHKIRDLHDLTYPVDDLKPESPGVAYAHGSIHCTWNNPGPWWKVLSVAVTVGSSDLKSGLWKYFFKVAGIGVTDLGPKPDGGSANFDDCWGTSESTNSDGNWSGDMIQFQMTPKLILGYHVHSFEADGYSVNGYLGPVHEAATDPSAFSKQWAGDFTRLSGPGGGGGG